MLFEGLTKKPPSLIDLCVRKAIDNVKYIGYVGGVDFQLLEQILQHCTLEQLKHIEDSTQDTDLSPVTDTFWKGFYKKHYGEEDMNDLIEDLEWNKVNNFKWRNLYELKVIAVQQEEKKAVDRLKERYKDENERKQSRQTKVCSKAPPSKRPFWGNSASGYNLGNVKSNIMKKAKLDLLKSQEVKNLTAIKRNTIQKSFSISAPKRTGLSANATSTSRSIPSGGQKLPPKRINSLPGTAPSTSKNAATRQKHVM
ncbi:uncharacterized protein LOC110228938 isoform X2 [Arabidopsis lyrata subsp. lyrata]|uniref:uncharacterized protein LOC110228938 isoform X2 n=1 Tax=Arabidopsis lyrata subsp. lyrata TaxID=81972 RepID=UPI000A29B4BC|nr:uncharacterized protein LOC110228938 isoform X2 [Arabidopsis lyrata subsp. lyrata]|eukprot:XP_020882996.1 uncharacterized protein LOC110228938 isoform X2 [Arabidopsis lyrata subsp. lyrata]